MKVQDLGGSSEKTVNHTVLNVPPQVTSLMVDPEPSEEGEEVTVKALFSDPGGSKDAPYRCSIDYGDGNQGLGSVVNDNTCQGEHTYVNNKVNNDEYTITVTVTDKDSDSGSNSVQHMVLNIPPEVTLTVDPPLSDEGSEVAVSATFIDPAGSEDAPYDCIIDYGDGSDTGQGAVEGNTCTGSHTYVDNGPYEHNGAYEVIVRVRDKDGGVGEDFRSQTVFNVAPTVASLTVVPSPSKEGSEVAVSAEFSDPGGSADAPYSCSINYGDGSMAQPGEVTNNTCAGSHTYLVDDAYTVTVTVADKDGGADSNSVPHTVENAPPTAVNAFFSPAPPEEGREITLTGIFRDYIPPDTTSYPLDQVTCTVDPGDGSGNQVIGAVYLNQASVVPPFVELACSAKYTYADQGLYPVSLELTDIYGASVTAEADLAVLNVAPTAAFANTTPLPLIQGEAATLVFSLPFDPSMNDTESGFFYSYDCLNDGSFAEAGDAEGVDRVSHACGYPDPGTFTARGRIEDKDGGYTDYTVAGIIVVSYTEAVTTLVNAVQDLQADGTLKPGQAKQLLSPLEATVEAVSDGSALDISEAVIQLNDFKSVVNNYIDRAILTADQGQVLIDEADRIIKAMQSLTS